MAMGARAVLCPMAAIFGGIVGQEVVKAATGKFHPIHQGFYFDAFECLPNKELPLESEFTNASDAGRYEAQVSVFGRSFQARDVHRLPVPRAAVPACSGRRSMQS